MATCFALRGATQEDRASSRAIFRTCYGPEFVAEVVRDWIAAVGAQTAYIEP